MLKKRKEIRFALNMGAMTAVFGLLALMFLVFAIVQFTRGNPTWAITWLFLMILALIVAFSSPKKVVQAPNT